MAFKRDKPVPEVKPLEVLETECAEAGEKFLTAFEERAKNEQARLQDATDSEFWIAVCFQTREQKEEFLQKTGIAQFGDKYLDGMKVAKKLGVTLESPVPPNRRIQKFSNEYQKRII